MGASPLQSHLGRGHTSSPPPIWGAHLLPTPLWGAHHFPSPIWGHTSHPPFDGHPSFPPRIWGSHPSLIPLRGDTSPHPFGEGGFLSPRPLHWRPLQPRPRRGGGVSSISRKFLPGIIAGEGGAGGATPPEPRREGLMPPGRGNATGRVPAGPRGSRMDAGSLPEVMAMGSLLCAGERVTGTSRAEVRERAPLSRIITRRSGNGSC